MDLSGLSKIICLCSLFVALCSCGTSTPKEEQAVVEDSLVWYPGRTFDYRIKADAARMRSQLVEIKTNENYIVDSLTHSVPYLIPSAKKELDAIGAEWADILSRNGLPHYRFYVTSVLRTQEDVKYLQRSGNINSTTQSCHCYGTTFDLAYMRYDKVTHTHMYMHEDNLKLVLGQVLLNHQRAGKIYVKYEWKQSCFHITVRN